MSELDIVSLIEQNPITKLSGNYHNKLITKIKDKFNDSQQQMFVASFYCFLNCDKKNDFSIDLDNVWKWLGFSQKVRAKELLEKHFKIDIDYTKSLSLSGKQSTHIKGGNNKETFMLNINTFKKFCLKAGTKKADEVHEYYIQLEETLHEVIQEESNELKVQLENYKTEIITNEKDKLIIREKTILQQFPNNTQCVYYGIIDNLSDKNEKLIKFGNSNFLKNRVNRHKETYSNFWLVNAFKVDNKLQIENAIKSNPFFIDKMRTITLNYKKLVELISIENTSFAELDKIIKGIITSIEFSPENYIKILQENKDLKLQLEIKNNNDNINDIVLLTTENKHLKTQNIALLKKLDSIKNSRKYSNEVISIDENVSPLQPASSNNVSISNENLCNNNYIATFNALKHSYYNNNVQKNENGKYFCGEIIYDKLIGTRDDVWNCKAYKTTGGLTKLDFILNHNGKIVSKKKSVTEIQFERFKHYGINK
jgi:phage anti-repressor protein